MSCFHPLLGISLGVKENGKDDYRIIPYDDQKKKDYEAAGVKVVEIPCGRCIGCRLEYSRQWANRMMLELQYHDSAYFVTLTYSDDFVPRMPVSDPETGEYTRDSYSLRKDHLSKFIKHVRKHFPDDKIRFFGVGEYGSKTVRPHYHVIIYGLHLDDLKLYKRTPQGDFLYTSEKLSKCWSNYVKFPSGREIYDQIGWVVVAPVTWETCAYTARYVTKKMSGPLGDWFISQNMELPFSLMSRRPGIARQWYEDHPDWTEKEYINIGGDKPRKFRPPKYFDRILEEDIPEVFMSRKEVRDDYVRRSRELLESQLDKPYLSYLADKENQLKSKLKALDRNKV